MRMESHIVLRILAVLSAVASLVCFSGPGVNTMDQGAVTACLFGGLFYAGLTGFLIMGSSIVRMNRRIKEMEEAYQ